MVPWAHPSHPKKHISSDVSTTQVTIQVRVEIPNPRVQVQVQVPYCQVQVRVLTFEVKDFK